MLKPAFTKTFDSLSHSSLNSRLDPLLQINAYKLVLGYVRSPSNPERFLRHVELLLLSAQL